MSIIYSPKGRAREYAKLAANLHIGECGHQCVYCYVPLMPFLDTDSPPLPKENVISMLEDEAMRLAPSQIFLCFRSDPYQPAEAEWGITREVVAILKRAGHTVIILTKSERVMRDVDLLDERDWVGMTLTLLDAERSLKWEPNASLPEARLDSLYDTDNLGIHTWVSLEPVLDPGVARDIIHEAHTFVHHFKVGKLNYDNRLPPELRREVEGINWRRFARDVVDTLESLGFERDYTPGAYVPGTYYIKQSLAGYLKGENDDD